MSELTVAMQGYLETIFQLCRLQGGARITDIAAELQVSKASANHAIMVLAEKGLVSQERYQTVTLTPGGEELAQHLQRSHSVLFHYFTLMLGVDETTADADACAIEHIISKQALNAMSAELEKRGKAGGRKK